MSDNEKERLAALDAYFATAPRVRSYILDDQGRLRRHVAIFIDGVVHAVLGFWSSGDEKVSQPIDSHAREILELMAKSIEAGIDRRRLTDQLAHQANHDALTGLPNRLDLQRGQLL